MKQYLRKNNWILFAILLFFLCVLGGMFSSVSSRAEAEPEWTQEPSAEPTPDQTCEPSAEPEESPSPTVKPLKKVTGVKAIRYSTNKIKITWKKQERANYYKVYYAKKKNGKYRYAGITKKQHYLVKQLKNNTRYYFVVKACRKKKASASDSVMSKAVHVRTKSFKRKTIFAGDSICQGIHDGTLPYLHIGGKKQVVAYKGLNTVTYHTKRIFRGKTGLQTLIAKQPYRIYMMLGINEIHYQPVGTMITEYQEMIRTLKQKCPNTDIVLCAISPVTSRESARRTGFRQIPAFNKKLKKMAKKNGVRYLDYTAFLKDSNGYLKTEYAQRDGYHWKPHVYRKFAGYIQKYDLSLDR